jgi:hypothetical protein
MEYSNFTLAVSLGRRPMSVQVLVLWKVQLSHGFYKHDD